MILAAAVPRVTTDGAPLAINQRRSNDAVCVNNQGVTMFNFSNVLASVAVAALTLWASAAQATCTIYTDADFKGTAGVVQPNDLLRFTAEGAPGKTLLNHKPRTFYDASWFEQVSSVQVTDNCKAVIWSKSGKHDNFTTTAQLPPEYDNSPHGLYCQCK